MLEGAPGEREEHLAEVICAILALAAVLTAVVLLLGGQSWRAAAAPAAVLGLAAGGFATLVGLLRRRERLVLDRVGRSVTHRTWRVLSGRGRERRFGLDRVNGVAVQQSLESPTGGFPVLVTRAKLLLGTPRVEIELGAVENRRGEDVERIAREVAEFLGVSIASWGGRNNPEDSNRHQAAG